MMSDEKQQTAPKEHGPSYRVPLTALVARPLIVKCFEQQDQWERQELAKIVEKRHREEGGLQGAQSALDVVKKVLTELRSKGVAKPVAKGLWRYIPDSDTPVTRPDSSGTAPEDPTLKDQDEQSDLQIDEVTGAGDESVYLYYSPNDRQLALAQGRSIWECKIGYTVGEVDERILAQGARTALSHSPVVGLVIRTGDARTLETVIHQSLWLVDAAVVDSPGSEWFMTSPDRVKAWYVAYMAALDRLKNDPKSSNNSGS
jgi:hypothetical protein